MAAGQRFVKTIINNNMLTFEEFKQATAYGDIDTVIVAQTDMQGRLMGKRFHAAFFRDSAWQETHACNYLLATDMEMSTVDGYRATSWSKGYGDYVMKPDLTTLRRIPWLEKTALVLCDVYHHETHQEVAHSPRAMLKKQIAELAKSNMTAHMASELEFFLFAESYEKAWRKGYRNLSPASPYNEDYHIFQTTKDEDIMRAIRNGLQGAGVPVENSKGEADAGQGEINIRYADALTMADRHVIVKNGCKEIAWAGGRALTFMAKWHRAAAGNSCHIHQSLCGNDGASRFYENGKPHGMSALMKHYLAGLLRHADAITYFLAPFVNSYKRFVVDTFAPTAAVWATDNRTAGYRVCATDEPSVRVECRVGGADLNPYLAMAALLAAGLDGIRHRMELNAEFCGSAYAEEARRIPQTLRAATAALAESTMLREAFGDEVIDHYVHAAQWEQKQCDAAVTDWDIYRGFERA